MAKLLAHARIIIGALALMFVVAAPALAQTQRNTDGSVNPTASAVNEQKLLDALAAPSPVGGGAISGRVSIPDAKSGTLIQPAGRAWREFHQVTLHWIGAIAILGMLAVLVLFYLVRGMVKIEAGRSGRTVVRFNAFERSVHWMTATCFIVLALSGLNITFGRTLLLPLLGADTFATWSQWGKYAHNYLSFPFTIGVALILLMWIANNIPNSVDWQWVKRGGGIVGNDHPPAYKFNAGQKMIYWIVVIGGGLSAVTGYILMFPFYATDMSGMQTAQVLHGSVGALFIAAMLGHIYIGTIGMEGAFEAMGTGEVDENWAKQHHSLWLEQEKNRAPSGATPRATPAE
ncbi:MAG: formate dehydrogenase subunit gamma [Xanthobacteraceae bacterium]|nr:formate dehydrogenase subunit gamma [Xanthobacteraceae bacterium]